MVRRPRDEPRRGERHPVARRDEQDSILVGDVPVIQTELAAVGIPHEIRVGEIPAIGPNDGIRDAVRHGPAIALVAAEQRWVLHVGVAPWIRRDGEPGTLVEPTYGAARTSG